MKRQRNADLRAWDAPTGPVGPDTENPPLRPVDDPDPPLQTAFDPEPIPAPLRPKAWQEDAAAKSTEETQPAWEERLRRLEEALAALQNQRAVEPRPLEGIQREMPPDALPHATPASHITEIGRKVLAGVDAAKPKVVSAGRWGWLFWDAVAEARVFLRMYVDPRYSLSWLGRIGPPVLLVAFFLTYYWVPFTSVPMFGWLLNKTTDLVLAFALFKILGHEARRYRETAPDLPASLRL
jgi:hypothetical protein